MHAHMGGPEIKNIDFQSMDLRQSAEITLLNINKMFTLSYYI